jgi:hypothetical protein
MSVFFRSTKTRVWLRCLAFSVMIIVVSLLVVSCSKDDDDDKKESTCPEGAFCFEDGDSIVAITVEAQQYAGTRDSSNHFNYRAYMYKEWQAARDIGGFGGTYAGSFSDWLSSSWEVRMPFLPVGFNHDILTNEASEYYRMIGKYFAQFGWGWQDTYNSGAGGDVNENSWLNPATGLQPDNPNTSAFDGESAMFSVYRSLWTRRPK